MIVQRRVAKLERLLELVRRNAARPRLAAVSATPADAPSEPFPLAPTESTRLPPEPIPSHVPGGQPSAPPASLQDSLRVAAAHELEEATTSSVLGADEIEEFDDELVEIGTDIQGTELSGVVEVGGHLEGVPSDELLDDDGPRITPPPESGPQASSFAPPEDVGTEIDLTGAGDVDDLLGAQLPPVAERDLPRPEQLGQTVAIAGEDAPDADLELVEEPADDFAAAKRDELEMTLPPGELVGVYDASLSPPPNARDELAEHDRREAAKSAQFSLEAPPISAPPPAPSDEQGMTRSVMRGPLPADANPARFEHVGERSFAPTFLELVDRSLALRAE